MASFLIKIVPAIDPNVDTRIRRLPIKDAFGPLRRSGSTIIKNTPVSPIKFPSNIFLVGRSFRKIIAAKIRKIGPLEEIIGELMLSVRSSPKKNPIILTLIPKSPAIRKAKKSFDFILILFGFISKTKRAGIAKRRKARENG